MRMPTEKQIERAFDVFVRATSVDPEPVSMMHELGPMNAHTVTVAVLRGPDVIEMFRQWAERNGLYTRGVGWDGEPCAPPDPEAA